MKVLFIDTERTWRGGENQMMLLIEGLQKRGIACFLAAQRGSEAQRRLKEKLPTMALSLKGALGIVSAKRLVRFCREQNIDLIDTQSAGAHNIGLVIKRFLPAVKLVVHRRVDYLPRNHAVNRCKYLTPMVDRYVAISTAIGEVLAAFGVPRERIRVVQSAVTRPTGDAKTKADYKKELCAELGIDPALPLISCVAYFTPQKDHRMLLSALAEVKRSGALFHCLLAGDGPLRANLEKQALSLNITHNVTFLGIRDDTRRILMASDIFALSSAFEGLGTSILDALFARCCVVATAVGGIPEMILHEKTGLLAPRADSALFGACLIQALNNPVWTSALAEQGLAYIAERFHVDKMVEGNLAVYQSLKGGTMDYDQTSSDLLNVDGGVKLLIRSWLPADEPKAVFLAIHGGLAHAGDFVTPARYFKALGVATHAIDLRWHGTYPAHNPGGRTFFHCENYEETCADIHKFYLWIKARHPKTPLFVLSHSNGSMVALKYGLTIGRDSDIKGFIVSSPWLKNRVKVSPILLFLAKWIAFVHPTFRVTPAPIIDVLTHDENIRLRHHADAAAGLVGTQASAKLGVESQKTQAWVVEHLAQWQKYPLFAVIAGDDALADPEASVKALRQIPANLLKLITHPENYHENFNELNREKTFEQIWLWMQAIRE